MPAPRYIPTADPSYGTPVIREPSPVESLNTEYGKDETQLDLLHMSNEEFARRVEEEIGLRGEGWGNTGPRPVLLPKPRNAEEERMLFVSVMENLRKQVKALEDEELFEANALRNLSPAFEEQPSSTDIDSIMQSLMGTSLNPKNLQANRMNPIPKANGKDSSTSAAVYRHANMNGRF